MCSIITSQSGAEPALMRILYGRDSTVAPSVAPFTTLPLNSTSWPRPKLHPDRPSVARMPHSAIKPTRIAS